MNHFNDLNKFIKQAVHIDNKLYNLQQQKEYYQKSHEFNKEKEKHHVNQKKS